MTWCASARPGWPARCGRGAGARDRPAARWPTTIRRSCPARTGCGSGPCLAGICGSDLATVDGRSSRWFEPIVSFPFVPGHEVVADDPDGAAGRARAGAGLRGPGDHAGVPRLRRPAGWATASTWPTDELAAGPADRLLLRHRRRLVDRDGGAPEPAPRRARRPGRPAPRSWSSPRRARSTPRSAAGVGPDDVVVVIGCRHPGPAHRGRARPLDARRAAWWWRPSTTTSGGGPASWPAGRTPCWCDPDELARAVRRTHRHARSLGPTRPPDRRRGRR